jgi:hypothetical protein
VVEEPETQEPYGAAHVRASRYEHSGNEREVLVRGCVREVLCVRERVWIVCGKCVRLCVCLPVSVSVCLPGVHPQLLL